MTHKILAKCDLRKSQGIYIIKQKEIIADRLGDIWLVDRIDLKNDRYPETDRHLITAGGMASYDYKPNPIECIRIAGDRC